MDLLRILLKITKMNKNASTKYCLLKLVVNKLACEMIVKLCCI